MDTACTHIKEWFLCSQSWNAAVDPVYKYKYKYKIKTYNAPYVTRVIRRRGDYS